MKLAIQVLSRSVALQQSGADDVLAAAKFCMMINDFFDCTNVRSLTEHVSKRNHWIKPYTSQDDERFSRLKDVFLEYLNTWKECTTTREGSIPPVIERKCFCLPRPTRVSKSQSTPTSRQLNSFLLRAFNMS